MAQKRVPIQELGLGARAEKALRRLGVTTLDKLLKLDPEEVLELEGCGQTVYERIVAAQKRLRDQMHKKELGKRGLRDRTTLQALKAGLGSWAQRCLDNMGVKDLAGLASLRFADFIDLKGFGENTWAEIDAVRNQAIRILGGIVVNRQLIKNPAALLAKPPTKETLYATPLFSGLDPELFRPAKYHAGWKPDWEVTELALTVRAFTLANRHNAKTLGQLLLLSGPALLKERNCHFGTLRTIYDAVETVVLDGLQKLQGRVDYRSFQQMLRSWINLTLSDTFAPVAAARFATRTEQFPTYDELSKKFGVTRARVGQIWEKSRRELRRRQNLLVLEKFWKTAKDLIKKKSVPLEKLAVKLQKAFKWKQPPPLITLAELLSLNPEFSLLRGGEAVRVKS